MITYEDIEISPELREKLDSFVIQVNDFREEGPLDEMSIAKLEEHFKASHVYHSTGIEGNRLTLQETALVLKEGIDVSGKPLKDTLEVKNLGAAFDHLKTLSKNDASVREYDIRSLHSYIVGNESKFSPGEYRKIGVIISGSEHRPPEPLEVPARMKELVDWLEVNANKNPIIVSAIAHHELAAIHPFVDGNGRVSRLLMNLILMKQGFPICNIRRQERPAYYEALSFADVGLFEPLIELITSRCADLFADYVRIREETKRMSEWAQKWGTEAASVLQRRESREMELWKSRIRQVFLEFQNAAELLDDQLGEILKLTFYDYKNEITFDQYQHLLETGSISQGNAFSVTFNSEENNNYARFMFRYFRDWDKFSKQDKVIPLQLNYYDREHNSYRKISELGWAECIRIREIYFTPEGEFVIRYYKIDEKKETEQRGGKVAEAARWFYDDILKNVFGLNST